MKARVFTPRVVHVALLSMSLLAVAFFTLPFVQVASATNPPKAYITNEGSDTVSVVDTATNTVVDTIGGLGSAPRDIALAPNGARAYVTNEESDTVSVIDTVTNTVIKTIPVGNGPVGIVITPDGAKAYVGNYGNTDPNFIPDSVSVIDTATNTMIKTIKKGIGSGPSLIAASPDGTRVYVSNTFSRFVSVIDTANDKVLKKVQIGDYPVGIAVSPDSSKVYVGSVGNNIVSVIDTATNIIVNTIAVGDGPRVIAFTPDGTRAYVANKYTNSVSVIDTATETVMHTIPNTGSFPVGVAVTPDGAKVFVTNKGSDTVSPVHSDVSVIDTVSNTVVAVIPVQGSPTAVAITPAATPNNSPTADAGGPYSGTVGLDITFDGSRSSDPDNDLLTYNWDFGDGAMVSTPNPTITHSYGAANPYTVTLVVNDGLVDSTPDTATATVTEPTGISVDRIAPNNMMRGTIPIIVEVYGSGFVAGADVTFENGSGPAPTSSNVVVVDANTITVTVTAGSGGPPRDRVWDVRVTNTDASTGVLEDGFTVTP